MLVVSSIGGAAAFVVFVLLLLLARVLLGFAVSFGSFGNSWENKILDHIFMGTALTQPTNIYVALSTADPLDTAAGLAEPSGNNYSRVSTAGADWDAAASGAVANTNEIAFPAASGSWGTISHFALFDHATNTAVANMIGHGALSVSKAVTTGDVLKFAAGDLDVTLD